MPAINRVVCFANKLLTILPHFKLFNNHLKTVGFNNWTTNFFFISFSYFVYSFCIFYYSYSCKSFRKLLQAAECLNFGTSHSRETGSREASKPMQTYSYMLHTYNMNPTKILLLKNSLTINQQSVFFFFFILSWAQRQAKCRKMESSHVVECLLFCFVMNNVLKQKKSWNWKMKSNEG